jgi:hypothetical protein
VFAIRAYNESGNKVTEVDCARCSTGSYTVRRNTEQRKGLRYRYGLTHLGHQTSAKQ